jgi:hypothetical protein
VNDIRLVATFEVDAQPNAVRILSRQDCGALAEALARDLVRLAEPASDGMLVVGGVLLEPGELLRPGLPCWQALSDLSRSAARSPDQGGQILAIGAHQGRLPDERLMPPSDRIHGQLLALPVLLLGPDALIEQLEQSLEAELFERGGLHPPSRAAFSQASGLDTGHGQWMTLNDFIALTHVQMDTVGLGAFWPVVEHALLRPGESATFDLPGALEAEWTADPAEVRIRFRTFNDQAGPIEDYALWTRAFRSLSALLSVHGMKARIVSDHTVDTDRHALVEATGPCTFGPGVTEQNHPDCGLLCWTLVEDERQYHLYPLDSEGLVHLQQDFRQRGFEPRRPAGGIQLSSDRQSLQAISNHE